MDEAEKKHYISREEFERATAHTHKYHYNKISNENKHFYASNDGRFFFIDDEGHKFYVDRATYEKAKAAGHARDESPGHAGAGHTGGAQKRFYHQEGNRYFYVDTKGKRSYVSKAEYQEATARGTQHGFIKAGAGKTYYSTNDGRYFYLDGNGSKVFVSREEYEANITGSPSKKRGHLTSNRYQTYYDSVRPATGHGATQGGDYQKVLEIINTCEQMPRKKVEDRISAGVCIMCTCGSHHCPAEKHDVPQLHLTPRGQFKSNYTSSYPKKANQTPPTKFKQQD